MTGRRTARILLALGATTVAIVGTTPPLAWAQTPLHAETTAVAVNGDNVSLVLTVADLPEGDTLNPAEVRVVVDGVSWPATAEAVAGSVGTVSRTAVIAVDTSGSMGPGGIADAQAAASRFLEVVPADVSVGLVTFAAQAQLVVPPTTDRNAVSAALATMQPGGNTTLYDGIGEALTALGRTGDRALIVLSDGEDTASQATLEATAAELATAGVALDLVAFGTDDAQRAQLDQLAAGAGGRVTRAENGAQLSDTFASAARTLIHQVTVTAQIPPEVTGDLADLTVEVGTSTSTAVATVRVELPDRSTPLDSTGTVATAPSRVLAGVPWFLPLVLVVAFLAMFLLFTVGLAPSTYRATLSQRRTREIERYGVTAGKDGPGTLEQTPAVVTQAALAWAGRTVTRRGVQKSWQLKLDRAAVPLQPHEWLIVRLAVTIAAVALGALALPLWLLTAPLAGLVGWLLTGAYLRLKSARRLGRFAENLPDTLQLVAGSLRSGFSLPQAVDNAAKDGEQPMAGELSRALAESRLGVDLEDALDHVAVRMASNDLTWTVMAVRIAREVGGNLAEVLLSTAETMRERARIHRQVKVLSAEGRLSAYVLIGLPVGITVFMVVFRRDYIAPLVTDPIGWVMTAYAVVSVLLGAWWMSRLIKLEV